MKIEFQKSALIGLLNTIEKFAFMCKNKKEYETLKVNASNDKAVFEIGSNYGFLHIEAECNIKEDGLMCLNVFDLSNIIKKLVGDTITIVTTNEQVIIQDDTSKIKLSTIKPESFIASIGLMRDSIGKLKINSKHLKEAADTCLPFEDEPQLIPGIHLKLEQDKKLKLYCCSNAAMGMYNIQLSIDTQLEVLDITLPTQGFKGLCDILKDEDIELEFWNNIVKVLLPFGFITLRALSNSYPNVEKLIPSSFECQLPIKIRELTNALDLIDIIAYDGSVLLEYNTNQCIVSNKAGFNACIKIINNNNVALKMKRVLLRRAIKLFAFQKEFIINYNEYTKPVVIKDAQRLLMLSVLKQK